MSQEIVKPMALDETLQSGNAQQHSDIQEMLAEQKKQTAALEKIALHDEGAYQSALKSQKAAEDAKAELEEQKSEIAKNRKEIEAEIPNTGGIYASVDLGLPSGRKWARMNVGANSETEHGDLFAWGATKPYRVGVDSTDNYGASKAATIQRDLLPNEDAATVNMGDGWRMPTKADYDELLANTDVEWTSIGGVAGRKFMKKSDHSVYVFFPASGFVSGSSLYDRGSLGYYWCRTYDSASLAWRLHFYSGGQYTSTNGRYYGFSVRGVRS